MSIALDAGGGELFDGGFGGFARGGMPRPPSAAVFEPPEMLALNRSVLKVKGDNEAAAEASASCSSSSSLSIGKNSDLSRSPSPGGDGPGETEVQSAIKGPLDALDALEEVLPMRRGISRFYNGKSKSFASLTDAAAAPSTREIAKPGNVYLRRRRNLLACTHAWNRNRSSLLRSNGGGISKRPVHAGRTPLGFAAAMCGPKKSTGQFPHLPPLHPHTRPPRGDASSPLSPSPPKLRHRRSFTWADLHHCAAAATGVYMN